MEKNTVIGLDLETSGLSPWRDAIATVQLYGDQTGDVAVLSVLGSVSENLRKLFENPNKTFVLHNGVGFDLLFLASYGVDIHRASWYDTMVGEGVVTTSGRRDVSVSLRNTMKRRLGVDSKKEIDHTGWMNPTLTEEQLQYAAQDVLTLPAIMRAQMDKAEDQRRSVDARNALKMEMELAPIIAQMTVNGMPINLDMLRQYEAVQSVSQKKAHQELLSLAGGEVNVNSPKQVKELFESLGISLPDTRRETLGDLAHRTAGSKGAKLAHLVLEERHANQRLSMYSDEWVSKHVVAGRVHPRYWQVGADTGRFTCSNPNMQQVPKDARGVFGWTPGCKVVGADYSQIEVVISAQMSGDDHFLDAVLNGQDTHAMIASNVFRVPTAKVTPQQRTMAKAATFTLLFGGAPSTIQSYAASYGERISDMQAEEIAQRFFNAFPGVQDMRERAIYLARSRRVVPVYLANGMRRVLVGKKLRPAVMLNTVVQGTAAIGIKQALIESHHAGLTQWLALSVHDEIVCADVPDADTEDVLHALETAMLRGMKKTIDVDVKVGGYSSDEWKS